MVGSGESRTAHTIVLKVLLTACILACLLVPFGPPTSMTLEAQFKGTSRNRRDRKPTALETQRTRRTAFDPIPFHSIPLRVR